MVKKHIVSKNYHPDPNKGAMTFSIITLSITTLSIVTLSIMTLSLTTFSITLI